MIAGAAQGGARRSGAGGEATGHPGSRAGRCGSRFGATRRGRPGRRQRRSAARQPSVTARVADSGRTPGRWSISSGRNEDSGGCYPAQRPGGLTRSRAGRDSSARPRRSHSRWCPRDAIPVALAPMPHNTGRVPGGGSRGAAGIAQHPPPSGCPCHAQPTERDSAESTICAWISARWAATPGSSRPRGRRRAPPPVTVRAGARLSGGQMPQVGADQKRLERWATCVWSLWPG